MRKKVSCHVITYNQKNYIAQCIDGILMQQVNFPIEIIIGDDRSTDGTREILLQYANDFPEIIKLNLREVRGEGIPGKENFVSTLELCHGEYISLCDGDDYWTDPLKLQKQVDFLENNPEFILHGGNAINIFENSNLNEELLLKNNIDSLYVMDDFFSNNNMINCTVIFRNVKLQFPKIFNKLVFGDWFLFVMLMKKTGLKAYVTKDIFSVYRSHSDGVMNVLSVNNFCSNQILQIISIHKYFGFNRLGLKAEQILSNYSLQKFRLEINDKSYFKAFKTFIINLKHSKSNVPMKKYVSGLKQHFSGN